PQAQVVTTGLATAATQFGGQVVPGDAGLEDEEDAGEDLAVVDGLAPGEAEAALGRRGQQGLEAFPQGIGDKRFHGLLLGWWRGRYHPFREQNICQLPHFFRTL